MMSNKNNFVQILIDSSNLVRLNLFSETCCPLHHCTGPLSPQSHSASTSFSRIDIYEVSFQDPIMYPRRPPSSGMEIYGLLIREFYDGHLSSLGLKLSHRNGQPSTQLMRPYSSYSSSLPLTDLVKSLLHCY